LYALVSRRPHGAGGWRATGPQLAGIACPGGPTRIDYTGEGLRTRPFASKPEC